MRFSTLLLLLTLLATDTWAQLPGARKTIGWQGQTTLRLRKGEVQVPTFAEAKFEPEGRLPYLTFRLDGYVTSVQLAAPSYEAFAGAEAKAFDVPELGAAPKLVLRHGYEKRRPVTLVTLVPLRRNGQSGQPEKLTAFGYTYTTGTDELANRGRRRTYATNSVLRQGEWFKVGIAGHVQGGHDGSGIYKLDRSFLSSLGLPVQSLDPRFLQLYGNAGGMLPQANSAARPDDLPQNHLLFVGNNDNVLDANEYFLFYGRGPHTWEPKGTTPTGFRHVLNLYADTAYYFLTVGQTPGLRVAPRADVTGTPTATIRQSWERQFYELDLVNLLRSGRQWLGQSFNNGTQREVSFTVPDLVPGTPLRVTTSLAATKVPTRFWSYTIPGDTIDQSTDFALTLNGAALGSQRVVNLSCGWPGSSNCYPEAANTSVRTYTTTAPASTNLRLAVRYDSRGDQAAVGYLDYVEVQGQRRLQLSSGSNQLSFRSLENLGAGNVSTFELGNAASGLTVWDVTNPRRPQVVALNGGSFVARTDSVREYVAFGSGNFDAPLSFGRVGNQNLHALGIDPVDLVIVTHPAFRAEAEKLKEHRRQHDGLKPIVVTTNQIYNEFSSGGQDITAIRDFLKMLYDRGNDLYVVLLGDASYDYKADPSNSTDPNRIPGWWKDRQVKDSENQNFVPTYESRESFARISPRYSAPGISYCSDDYFGFLDDAEGEWPDTATPTSFFMDAAIGRLPARYPRNQPGSAEQARTVVQKLIDYDKPTAQGKWRNRVTFVADDEQRSNLHIDHSEDAVNVTTSAAPAFNSNKVYLDLFPQLPTSGGQRSPDANAALDAAIEQGSVLVGYAGHGGPRGWADEQLLTNASVLQLQNRQKLTFMFTGTCDFAWYDDPAFNSAGEQILTDTPGGVVGLFTTTRIVDAFTNQALANPFYRSLFKRNAATGQWNRLGDAVVFGKNEDGTDVANRNFTLLGDPSMRLAFPQLSAQVRTINGRPLTPAAPDTIRALQRVKLEGDVTDLGGALSTTFNGTVQVTVYEKPSSIRTLGDQQTPPMSVQVQKDVVFDGQARVDNGKFQVEFVVPKDINYKFGLGKISLYAADPARNIDAHGAHGNVTIGGASATAALDTIPPDIRLAMDTESFVFGGLTAPNTTLLAKLSDASGINTAGTGIGHELTAVLDNDPSKLTVLNEYYTADVSGFTSGRVNYLFKNLETGPHSLKVKAWDTYNNSSERTVEFIVAKTDKLALDHVLNYPNPFANRTTFHFDHNRAGSPLDVQVQIFTVSGKLVRTLNASLPVSESHVKDVEWDGRDEFRDQLARGVYVYRVSVRTADGSQASKFEKLVLLN
ncbi:type IX secretion system sortase PorU [Hymenobacter sp. B81]|uniref:type IX secretion system sortase PorU n=1 Tax=Hymenobacter sp. B81 TaxID=3344878 RepID=UPI0037DCE79B